MMTRNKLGKTLLVTGALALGSSGIYCNTALPNMTPELERAVEIQRQQDSYALQDRIVSQDQKTRRELDSELATLKRNDPKLEEKIGDYKTQKAKVDRVVLPLSLGGLVSTFVGAGLATYREGDNEYIISEQEAIQ